MSNPSLYEPRVASKLLWRQTSTNALKFCSCHLINAIQSKFLRRLKLVLKSPLSKKNKISGCVRYPFTGECIWNMAGGRGHWLGESRNLSSRESGCSSHNIVSLIDIVLNSLPTFLGFFPVWFKPWKTKPFCFSADLPNGLPLASTTNTSLFLLAIWDHPSLNIWHLALVLGKIQHQTR